MQFSARSLCLRWCISMALRPNPPINRNTNGGRVLRVPVNPAAPLASGYWQRWASEVTASKSPRAARMLCAPVHRREDEELEVPAPKALDTKLRAANRGSPNTVRAFHQTKNIGLLTKLKQEIQAQKCNSVPCRSARGGAFQWH